MIKLVSKSENETKRLAEKIGSRLFAGAVLLLTGDLGAGKTVFVRGLARGMGVSGLVKSPSYNIMNIYEGPLPLIHFDLYRLCDTEEFYAIGADEYVGAYNVCAVEWHQHAKEAFEKEFIEVKISDAGDDIREIEILASGAKHENWLENAKNDINS